VGRILGASGGYLVEGGDGFVLAAFASPAAAIEWALDCEAALKTQVRDPSSWPALAA
jgi:hypothetical protein